MKTSNFFSLGPQGRKIVPGHGVRVRSSIGELDLGVYEDFTACSNKKGYNPHHKE